MSEQADRRGEVSRILARGPGALDDLMPIVYDELRQVAAAHLHRERQGHSLQPTALVNEAYLRLVDADQQGIQGRAHFFGIAARAIRQVLVDHARARGARKRGGDWQRVTLSDASGSADEASVDLLDLEAALQELTALDERKARILELRFFAGLSLPEVAECLGKSISTVESDWYMARAWIKTRLA